MLGGIYCGAIFGGSICAILIHTPGTPASAATALDGYELTKQGRAGKALGTACTASFFGGLLSCISLYFFAPLLAELAMKFGSPPPLTSRPLRTRFRFGSGSPDP